MLLNWIAGRDRVKLRGGYQVDIVWKSKSVRGKPGGVHNPLLFAVLDNVNLSIFRAVAGAADQLFFVRR